MLRDSRRRPKGAVEWRDTMVRVGRYAYVAVIWAFLAFLAIQIFFAGLGLFAIPPDMRLHASFGWYVHILDLLLIVVALLARVGRPTIWWVLALFLTSAIQPLLAAAHTDLPLVAALHPLNAVAMSLIAVKLALETPLLLRSEATA
jgi:hypothetical protein